MIDEFRIETQMADTMCSTCKRINPEYFEMKLQIRFRFFDNIPKLKAEVMDLLIKNFKTINKIDEIGNGYEVFFRDHGQMNKLAQVFKRRWLILDKRTSKIMGKDQLTSKDLFRHTQNITLVNLNIKDIVQIKGIEYWIKAINSGDALVLRRCDNGAKKVMSYKMIENYFKLVEKHNKIPSSD